MVTGERLVLMPERAVFWPETSTVLVADLHFGKAAFFRSKGFAVPAGTTADTLQRLGRVLEVTGAQRLIILGDILHARQEAQTGFQDQVSRWRDQYPVEMWLVRGNHDRNAGDPPANWRIEVLEEPYRSGPFALCHVPSPVAGAYTLAGHLHPVVRLEGMGRDRQTLPCFWMGTAVGVLPAFGSFTGSAIVQPERGDQVFVLAEANVVPVKTRR
jgi:DNA ligase-associated metallophosphoesterase